MSHNANGVQAAGGVIAISNSNISLNTSQGVNVSGGSVVSFGNNRIAFNASPGTALSPAGRSARASDPVAASSPTRPFPARSTC